MPRSVSSKKRVRQNVKRRAINRWRKDRVKTAVRELEQAVASGDKAAAGTKLQDAFQVLDRIAAKRTIHPNAASRKKARLAKRVAKMA